MPRLVRRNPTRPVAKLCVNCLSPLTRGSGLGGWLVPQDYYCKNCGYKGYVYLEDRRGEDEGIEVGTLERGQDEEEAKEKGKSTSDPRTTRAAQTR